jgi:CRP/FNR family transcriptional regulator, cyclic AMP receptor protein
VLVVGSSGGLDITAAGIAFALASAVTISLFLIALQRWVRRTAPLVSSLWVAASASVALTAAALVGGLRFPTEAGEWLAVGGMGALTAGAFMLLFLGVRRVGAVRSSVIASLEPVMAAVLAWIVLGEALRAGVIGGGVLILAGAVAASLARARPEPEAGPQYRSRPDWPHASRSWNTVRATGPEGGAAMDADRLKVVPLFERLSEGERRQVAQWTDEVEVQPGYHLVDQGAFAHEFFVILEGTAEVTKDGEKITELGPGDFFGEIALLGMERRTASVVATSPMRLAVMFGRDFRQMEHSMPEVHGRIEGAMRARLQD